MTEIPIDPVLREAVLAELTKEYPTTSDLADGIIRAINRVMYLNAVQQQAKRYSEMSKAVPDRKPALTSFTDEYLSNRCCCVPGTSGTTENIEFPCSKCPYHAKYARKKMTCFHHRKMERDQG